MYIYISFKINFNLENKIEIINLTKNPVPNVKYKINGYYYLGVFKSNENLDPNQIHNIRTVIGNVKNQNDFTLYFLVSDTVKNDTSEVIINVFSTPVNRTRSINDDMRYVDVGNEISDKWNNKKLLQLKRDKVISHQYMFGSQITLRLFDLEVNL